LWVFDASRERDPCRHAAGWQLMSKLVTKSKAVIN
jgi:hypothetical protein